MGFPSSPFNKANIVNGQPSDPADVNDVYAELAAIGDGLINGTAPVHTSNATVNAFTAGASTVASLSAGASTITELFVTKCPPYARVRATSTVSLPNNALTGISFDAERFVS